MKQVVIIIHKRQRSIAMCLEHSDLVAEGAWVKVYCQRAGLNPHAEVDFMAVSMPLVSVPEYLASFMPEAMHKPME